MAERHYLTDVLVLLLAVLAFVPLFQRLRIGSVVAYLAAGVLIGPSVMGLIGSVETARALAEFGVVFLLFSVGLEIKIERLRLFRPRVYGLAVAQVIVTTLTLGAVARLAGLPMPAALVVGGALSLSSTAVVLQLLSDYGLMTGHRGRTALAVLLVQDLAVGPIIVFISAAGQSGHDLAGSLGLAAMKMAGLVIVLLLAYRTLLRPLLKLAANTGEPEVFTGATLLLVLGTGWATDQVSLSMGLGAFIAGLMVADTEFRHQVAADIQPFRGLLLGLFFITVGMKLDIDYATERAAAVTLIVLGMIAIKTLLLAGLAVIFGLSGRRALSLGGLLSQGSEFAFVLFAHAEGQDLLPGEQAQLLSVSVGLSMVITPLGTALVSHLAPASPMTHSQLGNLDKESGEISGHVVVAGFGQVGMAVTRHLAGQSVPLLILDLSPRRVTTSRSRGLPVFYGNAARLDVLRAAHLDRAHALVVAIPEASTAEQVTAVARQSFPSLRIFARVPDESWVSPLRKAGADAVVIDGLTTALELAERVMLVYAPEAVGAS